MINRIRYRAVILLLGLFCNISMAESLRIYIDDEKDLLVFTGKVEPINIAGATNNMLLNAIGEYPIEFVPSSYKRALRIMSQQPHPTCLFNKVKTPIREANFLFSLPINLYLSRRLYIHSHVAPLEEALLDKQGNVKSLPLLLDVHKNKLIVIAGDFSYGPFLDEQLAQVNSENKVLIEGSNHYETVYRMFNLRRVDFLLAYPAEMYRHVKIDKATYQSYRIANSPEYILGHVMCNDTKMTRAFITKVNDVMVKLYKQESFIEAHLNYLPEEEHSITRRYIDTLK